MLFANLSARRMLRCRESDLVGHRFHDVAHHEHPDGTPYDILDCPIVRHASSGEEAFIGDQHYLRLDTLIRCAILAVADRKLAVFALDAPDPDAGQQVEQVAERIRSAVRERLGL